MRKARSRARERLLTEIDVHRNVRPMSCRAVDPKLFAFALVCVSIASLASAQAPAPPQDALATPVAPSSEPTPAAKEAARSAYGRGQAAFAQGQYDAARIAFEEAYAAVPNPIVLLSVSESLAKLGQIPRAIEVLKRYLSLRTDAPDRAQVEAKISALAATPATIAVTSVPPGAVLSVDNAPNPPRAPAQLTVPPGQHTLTYSLAGYKTSSELLVVEPGGRYELEIVLQQAPPEAPAPAPTPAPAQSTAPPPEAAAGASPAVLWVTGGLGAAGIITGTVLGFLALKEQSDFESNPTESGADRGERLALFADVGFGVGIMALATTAVLLFTQDEPDPAGPAEKAPDNARRPKPQASLELIPKLTPSTASATARVRF